MRRQPWALAIIYMVVSLAVEAALMVVGHLKVPQDNAILAPVVLTIPPVLAAWICGYRWPKELVLVAIVLSVLTLGLTLLAGRLTGVSTGLLEPIIVRAIAGFLAGSIVNRGRPRAVFTTKRKTILILLAVGVVAFVAWRLLSGPNPERGPLALLKRAAGDVHYTKLVPRAGNAWRAAFTTQALPTRPTARSAGWLTRR
ncbi:MAG: hypothetical protein HZA91_09995 [Verrucomicrobia bacterium]|nr:hypothetical protein [Verrucomicrobiota bacterium]